ncbi:hypothetical protein BaRGS_00032559 [Batillaria attramentaria]|uniref:RING-type domain-containing protein n=1 Tax=Batillaria attramentaria TaxID=370345 RepID=A0ABD0JNI0_9CAEN
MADSNNESQRCSGVQLGTTVAFEDELTRFGTFVNFPESVPVFVTHLAKAGFHYTGAADTVRCFRCGVTHRGWQSGDQPQEIHARISPNCPLVCRHGSVSSASSLDTGRPHSESGASAEDVGYVSDVSDSSFVAHEIAVCSEELPVSPTSTTSPEDTSTKVPPASSQLPPTAWFDLSGAVYPLYVQLDARRQSFQHWTNGFPNPDDLMTQGFFYTGHADCVQCFFCGIGLKSWKPTDNPAEVHARWGPTCDYLRFVRGDDFVDSVVGGKRSCELQAEGSGNQGQHFYISSMNNLHLHVGSTVDGAQHHLQTNNSGYGSAAVRMTQSVGEASPAADYATQAAVQEQSDAMCQQCLEQRADIIFVPCRHIVTCAACASHAHRCVRCDAVVQRRTRVAFF